MLLKSIPLMIFTLAFRSPELEVLFWQHGKFLNPDVAGPPRFVSVDVVLSQASRLAIKLTEPNPMGYNSDAEEADVPPSNHRLVWMSIGHTLVRIRFLIMSEH